MHSQHTYSQNQKQQPQNNARHKKNIFGHTRLSAILVQVAHDVSVKSLGRIGNCCFSLATCRMSVKRASLGLKLLWHHSRSGQRRVMPCRLGGGHLASEPPTWRYEVLDSKPGHRRYKLRGELGFAFLRRDDVLRRRDWLLSCWPVLGCSFTDVRWGSRQILPEVGFLLQGLGLCKMRQIAGCGKF